MGVRFGRIAPAEMGKAAMLPANPEIGTTAGYGVDDVPVETGGGDGSYFSTEQRREATGFGGEPNVLRVRIKGSKCYRKAGRPVSTRR